MVCRHPTSMLSTPGTPSVLQEVECIRGLVAPHVKVRRFWGHDPKIASPMRGVQQTLGCTRLVGMVDARVLKG
jgi:hypothetical protein